MLSGAMYLLFCRTNGRADANRKQEVHKFNSHIIDLKRLQFDCTKTTSSIHKT